MSLYLDDDHFIWYNTVRLPVRLEGSVLEFVVKHPRDQLTYGERIYIPVEEFALLALRELEVREKEDRIPCFSSSPSASLS